MFAPATTVVLLMLRLPAADDVPALAAKLAAPDYRTREAAGRRIYAGGEALLPALRAERDRTGNVEVADRLSDLIARLDGDRLSRPTRLTLRADRTPAGRVIAAIVAQSGFAVRADCPDSALAHPVTVAWDGTPFWPALDDVCRQAGLAAHPTDDGVTLTPTDTFAPHVAYSGPFRFVATAVSARRELPLAGLPRSGPPPRPPEQLSLTVLIQSEPRVPLVGLRPPRLAAGTDGLLSPAGDAAGVAVPFLFRSHSQPAALAFARADRTAAVARRLAGTVSLVVLAEARPDVTVPLADAPTTATGRSASLTVTAVHRSADEVTVTLTARPKSPPADPYAWANGLYQRLEVTDDRGRRWPAGGVIDQQIDATGVTLTLSFVAAGGVPTAVRVTEWVTHAQAVGFAFADLPLP